MASGSIQGEGKPVGQLYARQYSNQLCMFMKKRLVSLVYVDDVLFFGTTDAIIDKMISNLKRDFDLKVEENVFPFLGI